MDSASLQFVAYGLCVALVSNFSRSRAWRAVVLFLASLLFIVLIERNPPALLPLAGFLVLGYICLLLLRSGWSSRMAWVLVLVIYLYLAEEIYFLTRSYLHSDSLFHPRSVVHSFSRDAFAH